MPVETMLPRLRAGEILSIVPGQNFILRTGLTSLINRGFFPHDADFSRFISLKPDAGSRRDFVVRCLPRADVGLVTQQRMDMEDGRPPPLHVTAIPKSDLGSAAELRDEHHVDRKHYGGKRVLTTVADDRHWRYVRPSQRVRVQTPVEFAKHRFTEPTKTPVQSEIAPSTKDDSSEAGSDVDLFQVEAHRAVTARLIAASRDGPLLAITLGKIARHAPAFLEYRKSCPENWEAVDRVVTKFELFMQDYAVPYADLITKEVTILSAAPVKPRFTKSEILSCIANSAEVQQIISTPGQRYRGRDGINAAAAKIQGTFRMWIMRRMQFWHLDRVWATNIFIKFWKVKIMRRNVQQQVRKQYLKVHLKRFHRLLLRLKDEMWGVMAHKRIVIQLVPSKLMSEANNASHDLSVGRTFLLTDPLVETIFVTPAVDEIRTEYYKRILACTFPDHNPMDENRVRFIVPEAAYCFPDTAPLASMLLCSRKALASLRKMCQGKTSMIICDVVGEAEVTLSSVLSIPILGPTPEAYDKHLSTRARARTFLKAAGVPVAPALESHAIDESEMNLHIVKAISMFSEVPLWQLCPDPWVNVVDHREWDGPHAILDPANLTFCKDLYEPAIPSMDDDPQALSRPTSTKTSSTMKAHSNLTVSIAAYNRPVTAPPVPQQRPKTARRGMIAAHLQMARHEIPEQTQILIPRYAWADLARDWIKSGGILMAMPNRDARELKSLDVGIDVDMNGKWKFIAIGESILNKVTFKPTALVVSHLDADLHDEVSPLLDRIVARCTANGIVGTLTVQFLLWRDTDQANSTRHLWATHLRPHLTVALLRAATVLLATGSKSDQRDWKAKFPRTDIPLHIRYAPGARFMDQSRIRTSFHTKKIASLTAVESRTSVYIYELEHSQIAVMKRAAVAAMLLNRGIGFDIWTRTGLLYPELDSGWEGMFPFICVAENYEAALENAVRNLLQINTMLDDCTAECIDQDGSVYRNNFVSVAARLLYEIQSIKTVKTPPPICTTSRTVSPVVQKAFTDLGIMVVKPTVSEPPVSLFRGKTKFKVGEEDTGSDSDPEIVDPVDSTIKFTKIVRAQSAAPTAASDLSMLVSLYYPVPIIKPREATMAALKRRAHAAELRKNRRRAGFSAVTAALLGEGISSDFASTHDDTFLHPPLSPPFSRKQSEKMARGMSGKQRRGRAMLDRMEKEMDERTKKGLMPEMHTYRSKLTNSGRDRREEATEEEEEHNEGFEEEIAAREAARAKAATAQKEGQPSRVFFVKTVSGLPPQPPLDVDTVLEKLRDVAERGDRLSEFFDERMHNSQKILEEHHKTHLVMLEARKTDAEARAAQTKVLNRRAEARNGSGKESPPPPPNYLSMRRASSFPAQERRPSISRDIFDALKPTTGDSGLFASSPLQRRMSRESSKRDMQKTNVLLD
ncbi:hypothetical protein PhCBS80983_g00560 [Powellomyces hirtus]|uniref:IQCH-like ATP-grasp domain-containing protein n=1 Tax=Powellomyces hirtus TaxID=109895 RepID=A0A507EDU5_9FUNG|nr:hypothetical protein PhCBS80983_g00560 [Powellomyces hirtus]